MSSFTHSIAMSVPIARSVAIAALMGSTMLASPPTAARAETAPDAVFQLVQADTSRAAKGATEAKGETVEQRIRTLQRALKITSDQEPKWNAVAQAMRENAINMDTLIAKNRKTPPQDMTAVDDLKSYQKHAQAHVDADYFHVFFNLGHCTSSVNTHNAPERVTFSGRLRIPSKSGWSPGEYHACRNPVAARNLSHLRSRRQRLFNNPYLVVL